MWEFGVNKALMVFSGNTVLPPETDIFILGLWLQFWFVHKNYILLVLQLIFNSGTFANGLIFYLSLVFMHTTTTLKLIFFILYLCKCSAYVLSNTVLVLPHNHVS